MKLSTLIAMGVGLTSLSTAGGNITYIPNIEKTDTFKKYRTINVINSLKRTANTFIELELGLSKLSINDNTFSTPLISNDAFDDKAATLSLSIGHYITPHVFTKLNYQTSKFDISTITNTTFTLDYQFDAPLRPYVGVVGGYSNLTWERAPIMNFANQIKRSESFTLGLEAGVEYKLDKDFSFTAKIQTLKYDHVTNINGQPFEHNLQTNVFVGVKYDIY